ncbi:MAG: purine-nucleoside phosphorylase [Chloroflexi bacterium]|nr:purine-nucleoside phosphorylase [Chloroflexota bacterium]
MLKYSPLRPTLALVFGSGFQHAIDQIAVETEVSYSRVPGFPPARMPGHAGKMVWGHLGDVPILALCGRAHYYEGCSLENITFPVRVLAESGIRSLLLTNAAGGIHPKLQPGDFLLITDHINFMGANPLRGAALAGKTRFLDLTRTYDPRLRQLLRKAARRAGVSLRSGVYLAVSGPSYETPAEIRAFARLGADAVGMSTVPEAIVARQCGLAVAALSCITNRAAGLSGRQLSHADVLAQAGRVSKTAGRLLVCFAQEYAKTQ